MTDDTASRALADAYTAARHAQGMTAEPGAALEAGRTMAVWLLERGYQLVEVLPHRVVVGIDQPPSTIHLTAAPGQQIPPGGAPIEWQE